MTRVTLGLAVASCDEADLLERCLASAQGFDQILLLDLACSDSSGAIARRYGADVTRMERPAYIELVRGEQLAAAATDWLLFLDPDEELPDGWTDSIRSILTELPQTVAGLWIAYREIAFGKPLEHTRLGAAKIALVRPALASAVSPDVVKPHQPLVLDGEVLGPIPEVPLIGHHGYRNVEASIAKLARYATHGGVGMAPGDTMRVGPLTAVRMLWSNVVMGQAYRDGVPGIAVASLSAIGDYLGLLQIWDATGRHDTRSSPRTSAVLGALRGLSLAQRRVRGAFRRLGRHGRP